MTAAAHSQLATLSSVVNELENEIKDVVTFKERALQEGNVEILEQKIKEEVVKSSRNRALEERNRLAREKDVQRQLDERIQQLERTKEHVQEIRALAPELKSTVYCGCGTPRDVYIIQQQELVYVSFNENGLIVLFSPPHAHNEDFEMMEDSSYVIQDMYALVDDTITCVTHCVISSTQSDSIPRSSQRTSTDDDNNDNNDRDSDTHSLPDDDDTDTLLDLEYDAQLRRMEQESLNKPLVSHFFVGTASGRGLLVQLTISAHADNTHHAHATHNPYATHKQQSVSHSLSVEILHDKALYDQGQAIACVSFSEQAQRIATASLDQPIRGWTTDLFLQWECPLDIACIPRSRNLHVIDKHRRRLQSFHNLPEHYMRQLNSADVRTLCWDTHGCCLIAGLHTGELLRVEIGDPFDQEVIRMTHDEIQEARRAMQERASTAAAAAAATASSSSSSSSSASASASSLAVPSNTNANTSTSPNATSPSGKAKGRRGHRRTRSGVAGGRAKRRGSVGTLSVAAMHGSQLQQIEEELEQEEQELKADPEHKYTLPLELQPIVLCRCRTIDMTMLELPPSPLHPPKTAWTPFTVFNDDEAQGHRASHIKKKTEQREGNPDKRNKRANRDHQQQQQAGESDFGTHNDLAVVISAPADNDDMRGHISNPVSGAPSTEEDEHELLRTALSDKPLRRNRSSTESQHSGSKLTKSALRKQLEREDRSTISSRLREFANAMPDLPDPGSYVPVNDSPAGSGSRGGGGGADGKKKRQRDSERDIHVSDIRCMLTDDSLPLVVATCSDGSVRVVDSGTGSILRELVDMGGDAMPKTTPITAMAYDTETKVLFTCNEAGDIRVWVLPTSVTVAELYLPGRPVPQHMRYDSATGHLIVSTDDEWFLFDTNAILEWVIRNTEATDAAELHQDNWVTKLHSQFQRAIIRQEDEEEE